MVLKARVSSISVDISTSELVAIEVGASGTLRGINLLFIVIISALVGIKPPIG